MNDGGPAYPAPDFVGTTPLTDGDWQRLGNTRGMSLRQYYAGQAIIGLLAFPIMTEVPPHERIISIPDLAKQAFEVADAMIAAGKKEP